MRGMQGEAAGAAEGGAEGVKVLDLFCGAGGVCAGLQAAGYEVTGIDTSPQPWYPGEFILGDALAPPVDLADYDLIWASPPCQAFSSIRQADARTEAVNLIPATRALLAGHPATIIENVPAAPLRPDIALEWQMFRADAPIPRRRIFELSWPPPLAPPPYPFRRGKTLIAATGQGSPTGVRERRLAAGLPQNTSVAELRQAFGAHWIPADAPICAARRAINQMIPPVYAEFLASKIRPKLP